MCFQEYDSIGVSFQHADPLQGMHSDIKYIVNMSFQLSLYSEYYK